MVSKVVIQLNSVIQLWFYDFASREQIKPAKHLIMQYATKSTTGSVEMIRMINRIGDDVSYTPLEELDTSLCIQKVQI